MFGKRASFRWYARQDLNLRPSESESDALSAAPRARMFDLRRLAWVCFFAFGGQTVVKGVSLFCFRCPMCQCLQPLADFRYSTRRVCRSPTLYPAELRAHIYIYRNIWYTDCCFGHKSKLPGKVNSGLRLFKVFFGRHIFQKKDILYEAHKRLS